MFSRHLEVSLHLAMTLARQTSQEYLTVEHLLLALLENDNAVSALKACGAEVPSLRMELIKYLKKNVPKVNSNNQHVPQYTKGFDRVLQRAIHHVQAIGGGRLVEGSDILVAMFSEKDAYAVYLLKKQHISRLALTQYLSHGNQQDKDDEEIENNHESDKKIKKAKNPLTEFTVDLNQKAREGKTDPLIGRALEIERTAQILCRRRKNNPLLVGDPGVGKTSIAEGLAWLIVNDKAPKPLAGSVIYSLDMGALIAGTKYRGDFEKRMKVLLDALKKRPNAILFIDEIHMIIGAGSSMNSNMDVSNLIKPALANGDLRCIGSTTFTEYRQVFEKDHALSRRFQKIDIKEPSIEDSIDILRGLKPHYESFHQVKYTDEALVCAVKLSAKYIHERFLPDKAIDVIDEAGAYKRLGLAMNEKKSDKLSQASQTVDLNKIGDTKSHINDDNNLIETTDNDNAKTRDNNETKDIENIVLSKHITDELKINPDMLTQDDSYMSETVKDMIRKRQLEDEISKGLIKDGGVVYDSLADLIRDVQEKDGDDEEEYVDDYDEESTRHQQNDHQNDKSEKSSTTDNKEEQTSVTIIDVDDIENIIAKLARIPPKSVSNDDKSVLAHLDRDLKRLVFGQDEAISTLVDAIKLSRAGLKPLEKPIGSFMFAGPTGVGKTEVSRQLANLLGVELIRFDMSEYMEAHTASRLIGAPPGYVGFDQGGLLTEKINQYPHCVLLLDEIEKAHSDVFNLLLQVMDHGTLTDNNGRVASFKQVILIMTTNVGADSISRASIGFTEQDHSRDNGEALKRAFTPEFRNRLDAVIHFNPLDTEVIVSVVDKFLVELQAQLDDKQVVLEIDDEVRQYLAKKGYDRLMGARPMQRLIQNEIKKSLADMILFGDLVNGGTVKISLDNDQKIQLEVMESLNSNKQPQQKMDC